MEILIRKGTYLWVSSWVATRWVVSNTSILNIYRETLVGFIIQSVQMVSTACCFLRAVPLKTALTVGMVGEMYISRTGDKVRSLWLSGYSSWVNQQSHPLDDLLQHATPCDWLLQTYPPHSSAMRPEQSARLACFISMEVVRFGAIWPYWRQIPQNYRGTRKRKCRLR